MQVVMSTLVVVVLVVMGSVGATTPATTTTTTTTTTTAATTTAAAATAGGGSPISLEEAFADRIVVKAMVDCFIDETKCDAEQEKIRVRALAAMRNMGRCPESLCTPEQQKEMTHAMEMLQMNHRDLWIDLLVAMFDLDLPTLPTAN